jgi:hypothetical protein
MVMNLALPAILRRSIFALACLGLLGVTGCKQHFHPQYAHAIGGGTIGKGPSTGGKKRGIGHVDAGGGSGNSSGIGGAPMARLFSNSKAGSGSAQKRDPNTGFRSSPSKAFKSENPLGSGKDGRFGKTNPFDNH